MNCEACQLKDLGVEHFEILEILRSGVSHTILLFHRALGLIRPKDVHLELFDITYVNGNAMAIVLETSMTDPESLAYDGVEDSVFDFRSKENEDSEVAVGDSAKSTISETSMTNENGVSESTTNDIVEDNTLDFIFVLFLHFNI